MDGLKVWFDEWVLKPFDSISAKIEAGLEHSRVLVLCISANAFGSDWAKPESGAFLFCDPLNKARHFLPLCLGRGCRVTPKPRFKMLLRNQDHASARLRTTPQYRGENVTALPKATPLLRKASEDCKPVLRRRRPRSRFSPTRFRGSSSN